jgi:hypothetical protein
MEVCCTPVVANEEITMLIIESVQENIDPTQHLIEHGYEITEAVKCSCAGRYKCVNHHVNY